MTALGFGYLRITPTILDGEDWYLHGIYNVAIGQAVARRERIGVFGDRAPSGGYVTGPHLHYEVQSGGWMNNPSTSRDPVPFLTAAFGPGGGTIGGADVTPAQDALLKITAYSLIGPPPPKVLAYLNVPHTLDDAINLYNTSNTQDVINSFGQDGYQWMQRLAEPWLTTKGGGNINEPAEPAEPSKIVLTILSVPGTATGTIS